MKLDMLRNIIESKRIPNALLFFGANSELLTSTAKEFATEILGSYPHPDLREIFPEGKLELHTIDKIRKMIHLVALLPYQAKKQIFVIHNADRMLPACGNALLKTLEEPSLQTIIILLTTHSDRILPTILSRCQKVFVPSLDSLKQNSFLEVLAGKKPLLSEVDDKKKEEILTTIFLWYRDRELLSLQGGDAFLSFPSYRDIIAKQPKVSLTILENLLWRVQNAQDCGVKFSTSLQALFFSLENFGKQAENA